MTITAITIENFKVIKEPVRVEIKPITLLFGPNSAGKSTIVQALHYGREIFERQNIDPDKTLLGGDSIDLGGFVNLVHNHDKSLPIRLGFELDLQHEDLPDYLSDLPDFAMQAMENYEIFYQSVLSKINTAKVEIEVRWDGIGDKPYLARYCISANGEELLEIHGDVEGQQIAVTKIDPLNPIFLTKASTSQDARVANQKMLEKWKKATERNEVTDDLYDLDFMEVGDIFPLLFLYCDHSGGVSGVSKPINLPAQKSALPVWEKELKFDENIWEEGFDDGEISNLKRLLSSLIVGPGELVRDSLRKLCYIGPLREVPGRNHKPATSPEEARWSKGLAAYDILARSEESFISKVNKWLAGGDRLNTGYSIEVKKYRELENDHPLLLAILQNRILDEDINMRDQLLALPVLRRLLIRDEARGIELAPQDIGVGISQVLPVVVAALHQKTGVVAIEQPELHIHPALQVALGDLFIQEIRNNTSNEKVFLLETHSEHLLLRLLRRIRETTDGEAPATLTLKPSELSILFLEEGVQGVNCHPIRVDEDGDFLDRWPRGFFAERAEELF